MGTRKVNRGWSAEPKAACSAQLAASWEEQLSSAATSKSKMTLFGWCRKKKKAKSFLVLTADYWQRRNMTTTFVGGAERLSTVFERGYRRSFHLIKLVPDSGVETATEVSTPVPATSGIFRTFRKGTVKTEVLKDKGLYLNKDLTLSI